MVYSAFEDGAALPCCLLFTSSRTDSLRLAFRINVAMCGVESGILRLGDFGLARKSTVFAIFEVPTERE